MIDFISEYPYFLALLIFLARVADVSLGTFRTIRVVAAFKIISLDKTGKGSIVKTTEYLKMLILTIKIEGETSNESRNRTTKNR
jgi:hypothetical protein